MVFNLQDPPPRRWVEPTIVEHAGLERVGVHMMSLITRLQQEDPDQGLAQRIIADDPHFLYGRNAGNRYAHAGWAYLTLDLDEQAWRILVTIERTAMTFIRNRSFPVPSPTALIFIYTALRMGKVDAAFLGIQLARLRRLTVPEQEDLAMLEACLQATI